jgi:hypothetical protein
MTTLLAVWAVPFVLLAVRMVLDKGSPIVVQMDMPKPTRKQLSLNLTTPNARKIHDAEVAEVMSELCEDHYPGANLLSFDGERFDIGGEDTLDAMPIVQGEPLEA